MYTALKKATPQRDGIARSERPCLSASLLNEVVVERAVALRLDEGKRPAVVRVLFEVDVPFDFNRHVRLPRQSFDTPTILPPQQKTRCPLVFL